MTVTTSVLTGAIHGSLHLQNRVEAIVQADRWNHAQDLIGTPIPMDDLMWAVGSNPSIQSTVQAALAEADPEDQNNVERAVPLIPDSDLEYVVLTVAMPVLTEPEPEPEPAPEVFLP
jgi:hypothetical protein